MRNELCNISNNNEENDYQSIRLAESGNEIDRNDSDDRDTVADSNDNLNGKSKFPKRKNSTSNGNMDVS